MLPFVIYYDIEALLTPTNTQTVRRPINVCAFTKCKQDDQYDCEPVLFTGLNCIDQFMKHALEQQKRISWILCNEKVPLQVDSPDQSRLTNTHTYDICQQPCEKQSSKYRDHDHLNTDSESNLRYVACNRYNLTHGREQLKIPVVAHNSCRYDLQHIVAALKRGKNINILAKNRERG